MEVTLQDGDDELGSFCAQHQEDKSGTGDSYRVARLTDKNIGCPIKYELQVNHE